MEKLCPNHGPYDASYASCPFCSGARPGPVGGIGSFSDLPTDIGAGRGNFSEAPTDLGPGYRGEGGAAAEDPTQLGQNFARGGGRVEELEKTQLGRGGYADDQTELEVVETGTLGLLWCKSGGRRGATYRISPNMMVGRKGNGLVLDDRKVSNPHAKFTLENGAFVLWDFGSSNGTYVNGERIREARPLKENDEIKFGDHIFLLKVLA